MRWADKIWGRTRELVDSSFYSKYELDVLQGGYCSLHYHKNRANRFIIIDARIEIVEFYGPTYKRIILSNDQTYDVPSLVPHLFIAGKAGKLIEEYYPDRGGRVERDDIIRLTEGGISHSADIFADIMGRMPCLKTCS